MTDRLCPDCQRWTEDGCDCTEAEHNCRGGWIDPDADNPRPCIVCKPHLAPAKLHQRAWGYDRPPRPKEAS